MNKRHAKPTTAQLVARIYRQQIALTKALAEMQSETRSGLKMLYELGTTQTQTNLKLTDHCARLLREKETLQKQVASLIEQKKEADRYLSSPIRWHMPSVIHGDTNVAGADVARQYPPNNPHGHRVTVDSNGYITSRPVTDETNFVQGWHECAAIHLHREGVLCGLCGQIGL